MVRPFVLSLCFVLFWALCLGENVAGAERLTSTGCPSLRWGVYPARLDLFYFYLVEFDNTTTPDLQGIERAIAVGLVDTLSYKGCNVYGEPVMAVELTEDGHRYSSGVFANSGICSPNTPRESCRVVRGLTSILLDTSADGVADVAYEVMVEVLSDLPALNEFLDTPLLHAEFVREIGENLVLQPLDEEGGSNESEASSGASTKIAIISAVTAFILSAIFFLGIHRHQHQKEDESVKMRLAYYQAKRRKFWSQLKEDEDQHTYPGLMMTEPQPVHTVTWSVSDLTSESASIKSALKMDPIDEEQEGGSNESHAGDSEEAFDELYEEAREEEASESKSSLPRPSLEIPPFIAHWQDDQSEMATRGTNLSERVWEMATLPKSYWDVSDPEAPTPDQSPASFHGSPERVFLDDDDRDDESFADRQLDFSKDSPPKLPAVTYTTEEEEYSQASSAPNLNQRQYEESILLKNVDSSLDDSEKSISSDPYAADLDTSLKYHSDSSGASKEDMSITKRKAPGKTKVMLDPDGAIATKLSEENSATLVEDASESIGKSSVASVSSSENASEDDNSSFSDSDSLKTFTEKRSDTRMDVFYTPKQDATTADSLESVAMSIVRDAAIYDEATQRWARRILEEIQSPKPMMLAASPHN